MGYAQNKPVTSAYQEYAKPSQLKAKHVLITLLKAESAEPIYGVFTLMMTEHRTQLLSTTKGDLRPRLANLQSKFAKLICFSSSDVSIS